MSVNEHISLICATLLLIADEHATCTDGEVEGTRRKQHYEALVKTADEHGTTLFKHIERLSVG